MPPQSCRLNKCQISERSVTSWTISRGLELSRDLAVKWRATKRWCASTDCNGQLTAKASWVLFYLTKEIYGKPSPNFSVSLAEFELNSFLKYTLSGQHQSLPPITLDASVRIILSKSNPTKNKSRNDTNDQRFAVLFYADIADHTIEYHGSLAFVGIMPSDQCIRLVLQWRNNEHDGVSNHQPHDCLLKHLFRRRSKETSKFRVTGLCAGNSPVTGEFPAQRASYAENVSIWWRHHGIRPVMLLVFPYHDVISSVSLPISRSVTNTHLENHEANLMRHEFSKQL